MAIELRLDRRRGRQSGKKGNNVTPKEKVAIIEACWLGARSGPHCFIDDDEHYPSWFETVHPDGMFWYYDQYQSAVLEMGGLRIPLTTRWILCPEHEYLAKEEVEGKAEDGQALGV
jgi:hypothetical protein